MQDLRRYAIYSAQNYCPTVILLYKQCLCVSPEYEQEIGRRLYSTGSGATLRSSRAIPTDWIVSHVERYEPDLQNMPLFREVIIAYCEKKPMTIEEYKSLVYEREGQVSAESFGGNEQHYQEWLKSNGT